MRRPSFDEAPSRRLKRHCRAARSNGGHQESLGRRADGRPRAFRRVRPPSTMLYPTQAPRATAAGPPGLRRLDGFGRGLRPPARAALRAAGAPVSGSGALPGPGAAAFPIGAAGEKEAAPKKTWGIGAGHRAAARGLGRPLSDRDGRRARFRCLSTSRRLQLPMVRGFMRPARGECMAGGGAVALV